MSKHSTDADVTFIAALAELLNKNDLTELSVKREYGADDSLEVRVVKQATVMQMAPAPAVHYAAPAAAVWWGAELKDKFPKLAADAARGRSFAVK